MNAVLQWIESWKLVDNAPVGSQMLQTHRSIDVTSVPHDWAFVSVGRHRYGQYKMSARLHHAPDLSRCLQVSERRYRIAVATQAAVLQRRVSKNGVKRSAAAANKLLGQTIRSNRCHLLILDDQFPWMPPSGKTFIPKRSNLAYLIAFLISTF